MKRFLFVAALACLTVGASAQKGKLNNVENTVKLAQLNQAKDDALKQAQALFAEVLANEKTAVMPKTYLVGAKLESILYTKKISDNGFPKVKEYMEKAEELDAKGDAKGKGIGKAQKDIQSTYAELIDYGLLFNIGATAYERKEFGKMRDAFLYAISINQRIRNPYNEAIDSLSFFNCALGAKMAEDYGTAAKYFEKCIGIDYSGTVSTQNAYLCYQALKDSANMESVLKRGFEKYPSERSLVLLLVDFYMQSGRNEEAVKYLNDILAADATNPNLLNARASLFEKLGDKAKAETDYLSAIKADPNHFYTLFNLSNYYFYQADDIMQAAQKERDDNKYNAIKATAKEPLEKAASYIDRTVENCPKEYMVDALKNATAIYYRLISYFEVDSANDKYKTYNDRLKELQQ